MKILVSLPYINSWTRLNGIVFARQVVSKKNLFVSLLYIVSITFVSCLFTIMPYQLLMFVAATSELTDYIVGKYDSHTSVCAVYIEKGINTQVSKHGQ